MWAIFYFPYGGSEPQKSEGFAHEQTGWLVYSDPELKLISQVPALLQPRHIYKIFLPLLCFFEEQLKEAFALLKIHYNRC